MRYIKPEIEINMIHTEDVITSSGLFNWIVNSGKEGAEEPKVSTGTDSETKKPSATVNVGADFFG